MLVGADERVRPCITIELRFSCVAFIALTSARAESWGFFKEGGGGAVSSELFVGEPCSYCAKQ